jgi:hypothetical protein
MGWRDRYRVTTGIPNEDDPDVRACLSAWAERHPYSEESLGVAYVETQNNVWLGVLGPAQADEKPDTNVLAARTLLNVLLTCPRFDALLKKIQASGVASHQPMEKLPTAALAKACEASASNDYYGGTGQVRVLFDACNLALARDPTLAGMVEKVQQSRRHERSDDDDRPAHGDAAGAGTPSTRDAPSGNDGGSRGAPGERGGNTAINTPAVAGHRDKAAPADRQPPPHAAGAGSDTAARASVGGGGSPCSECQTRCDRASDACWQARCRGKSGQDLQQCQISCGSGKCYSGCDPVCKTHPSGQTRVR